VVVVRKTSIRKGKKKRLWWKRKFPKGGVGKTQKTSRALKTNGCRLGEAKGFEGGGTGVEKKLR